MEDTRKEEEKGKRKRKRKVVERSVKQGSGSRKDEHERSEVRMLT